MGEGGYHDELKKLILLFDKRITKIEHFEWVLGMDYTEENLQKIKNLIKNKRIDELIQMVVDKEKKNEEDLTLVKFNDQNGILYAAIIWDSDYLWEDPRILEIYPI